MRRSRQPRVLAVAIDAAEPTLIQKLIGRGELLGLAALLDRGGWALVGEAIAGKDLHRLLLSGLEAPRSVPA